jgi:hypothetical protein
MIGGERKLSICFIAYSLVEWLRCPDVLCVIMTSEACTPCISDPQALLLRSRIAQGRFSTENKNTSSKRATSRLVTQN